MDKCVILKTFCDKKEIADKIVEKLLEKRLVAGSQTSILHSKYWWNKEIEECDEFCLEFRTKASLFDEIKSEIEQIHDYDVCEISCIEIVNANDEFIKWIVDNTK